MSVETEAGTKRCCKCNKDITHLGRMKASNGDYWCIQCGQKDEVERTAHAGGICFGCGEPFIKPQLTKLAGHVYCNTCLTKQYGVRQSFLSKVWTSITGRG